MNIRPPSTYHVDWIAEEGRGSDLGTLIQVQRFKPRSPQSNMSYDWTFRMYIDFWNGMVMAGFGTTLYRCYDNSNPQYSHNSRFNRPVMFLSRLGAANFTETLANSLTLTGLAVAVEYSVAVKTAVAVVVAVAVADAVGITDAVAVI